MRLVALFSAKGSPGVTTLACCLGAVWPAGRRVVVMEADPAGGAMAYRFGVPQGPGTATLALANRQGAAPVAGPGEGFSSIGSRIDITPHIQRLPGGLEVLVGPASGESAMSLDREIAGMAALLATGRSDADLIVDCGRLSRPTPGQLAILQEASDVLVVSSAEVGSLGHTGGALSRLCDIAGRGGSMAQPRLVLTHSDQSDAAGAAEFLDVPLAGAIPHDAEGAAIACGRPGSTARFAKSPIIRASRYLAGSVVAQMEARDACLAGGAALAIGGSPYDLSWDTEVVAAGATAAMVAPAGTTAASGTADTAGAVNVDLAYAGPVEPAAQSDPAGFTVPADRSGLGEPAVVEPVAAGALS